MAQTVKAGQQRRVLITINALFEATGSPGGVVVALRDIQQMHELREQLKGQSTFNAIIGKNLKMREIYRLIEQVADSQASVLIHGESGTGKELVAHAIRRLCEDLADLAAPQEGSLERQRILDTLKSAGGLNKAARRLGISRTLLRKPKRIQHSPE